MDKLEMKKLDIESLKKEVQLCKKEIFNLKLNAMTGQMKDISQFGKLRKQIARALTYLTQKQNAESTRR